MARSAVMRTPHVERHRTQHVGWLRAAVLGANDGAISTASLVVGVAAAHSTPQGILIAGIAGVAAGAMAMAAGEYVSVSSQADTEGADLDRERKELAADPEHERKELAEIYVARGLTPELAAQVAEQLMSRDALAAHARDSWGLPRRSRPAPCRRHSLPRRRSSWVPSCRSPPQSCRRPGTSYLLSSPRRCWSSPS